MGGEMYMKVGVICVGLLLCIPAISQSDRFSHYKHVEAYEVRPDILMLPRYSKDGQVCEIALQKRLYSSDGFYSDPTLKRAEINKIVDELVSPTERGEKVKGKDMILQSGSGMSMNTEYENVSIVIYSDASQHQGQTVARDTVATITWKHRICQ
jgi:hypothetical protein